MKPEELCIGDWVRRRWTCVDIWREIVRDFQVTEIRKNGKTLYAWGKGGNIGWVEKLEPIPLTTEILEKNGFAVGKYKLPISDKEIDKFSLSEVSNEYVREVVLLPITMNCTWCFSSVDGTCIPVIKYVHELQHALRLCGIKKEITI